MRTAHPVSLTRVALWSALTAVSVCAPAQTVPPVKSKAPDVQATTAVPYKKQNDAVVPSALLTHPVLWHAPQNISSLDLYAGPGGPKQVPAPPFSFAKEDMSGTNPKFNVRDANGVTWRCKLGDEARPEVVASRLLWAVGYYANVDYLLPSAEIQKIHMKRGGDLVHDNIVENARFARKPEDTKKLGIWDWKTNPFYGSREFNGLRVMMAVMNNWDLKNVNNAVYQDSASGEQIFLVSDVGASFGSNGLGFSKARSKGNIESFKDSKFVKRVNGDTVDFATPSAPTKVFLLSAGTTIKQFHYRSGLDWIGNDIPVADARWMGSLLGQLTHQQIADAFRAGNFPQEAIDAYVGVVESRIAALKAL